MWNFFIDNRRFTYLLIVVLTAFGLYSVSIIPKESAPEVHIPVGIVTTILPGAPAVDIENQVTNVTFTGNRIRSVDGLPINEVLFFAPTKLTYTNNIIDNVCNTANLPAGTLAIVEDNTDERGIQLFDSLKRILLFFPECP